MSFCHIYIGPTVYIREATHAPYVPYIYIYVYVYIQFNSVYLYSPISQITNLSRSALQSVHIDIRVPKPHIGSGKTPK